MLDVIKPAGLAKDAPSPEDWYANLLWLDGRKCLLLTHAATLFTIFEPDVRAATLRDTRTTVTCLIARELVREGLPADTFGELKTAAVTLAKTADRTVLGCMNDMAHYGEAIVYRTYGGLAAAGLADINQALRRNINSVRAYRQPIELVTEQLAAAGLPAPDHGVSAAAVSTILKDMDDDLCFTPAAELARLLRNGNLSARELLDAFLNRIHRINPQLNAIFTLAEEQASAGGAAADEAAARGDRSAAFTAFRSP